MIYAQFSQIAYGSQTVADVPVVVLVVHQMAEWKQLKFIEILLSWQNHKDIIELLIQIFYLILFIIWSWLLFCFI